ncbi:uncharacterized protein I206_107104 [Kwoniella pini CBS 10737]|uniref:Essential protein Yae1 N-terminal domain-containing protein n=1 Tax=Kwoniella pini CBS 10737 TaxID=1296096 RepID=A0A1B9HZ53_9TREE|nr:uncharacterized protein I206_05352 [Kwoniella pini CBS 10737]OCF48573.1 hypothetical protein I206_05352 [Kwoniella pini CBS 10737]
MQDELDFDMMNDKNDQDVLEEITNMESKFYQEGYKAGYDHGELHGLYEGRELGKEKSWELWEEIGYYEGFIKVYIDLLSGKDIQEGSKRGKDARALNHAQILLSLINTFPISNSSQSNFNISQINKEEEEEEIDLINLISNIRARYKLLCSSLNLKPRLQNAQFVQTLPGSGSSGISSTSNYENIQEGIEGPIKGVDTRQLRF